MKLFLPLKHAAFILGFLFVAFVIFYSNYEQKEIQRSARRNDAVRIVWMKVGGFIWQYT